MTIVVGYPPNRKGKAALNLGALLSRSSGQDLVVCTVAPQPWLAGVVREDDAFQSQIDELTGGALDQARSELPSGVNATYTTVKARSASAGLLEAAEEHKASLIVVGSSAAGLFGRIQLSSVADRLLHSSHVPVALAPRGFRAGDTAKVDCITVAYTGTQQCDSLLRTALDLVTQLGTKMRLASFAVQPSPPVTAMFHKEEADVTAEWTSAIERAARRVLSDAKDPSEGITIGRGHDWETALNDITWHDGDLLLIGSSESGPVARVFLGSRAAKIIRHSPVPVLVVPRDAEQ